MYTDFYLKFADEAEANSVLYRTETVRDYERELTDEEKALGDDNFAIKHIEVPNYMNIDVLGVLYEKQEVVDPENPPEPVPLSGWHVNVRVLATEDATPLTPYAIQPTQPRRVWG